MAKIFLVSDTHFGHENILKFTDNRKELIRGKIWTTPKEMDEALIENWNSVVGPKDKVYHLGDACIKAPAAIFAMMHGDKVLIKGNHDGQSINAYKAVFRDVRAYGCLDNNFLSHIPIHPGSFGRNKCNIHGHLHQNIVMREIITSDELGEYIVEMPDLRYYNVSVEHTNYTPIDYEQVREEIKLRNL